MVDKRRPAIVVQTDHVRDPRIRSFLVVPVTSRLHLEGLPGNVRLSMAETRLSRPSVANVYDIQRAMRQDFLERIAQLPAQSMEAVADGLRLVLDL